MTKTCLNPVFCRPAKLSQFRLCWWFSSKSKTFYLPFFFSFHRCRVTTPRLCPCWLRPSQVRSASWTQSFVLRVERREPRRDAPSVKWWAQKTTAVIFLFKLPQCSVRASTWLESTLYLFVAFFFYQLHSQIKYIFLTTRWSTVKKPAKRCTGSPTRKFARSFKSRERSRRQNRPNWGCSRAKVPHLIIIIIIENTEAERSSCPDCELSRLL